MSHLWPYMRDEIVKAQFSPEQLDQLLKISKYKYSLHMVYFTSDTLPKRIELGDAVETNAYHLFIYMLSRFYYFDNGGEIIYYYPNKHNNYLVEKALSLLPPRFKRETEKTPGYEYFEMPGCLWYTYTVGEPWMYSYVRNLYKEIWESVPQVKGKYSYISRNPREAKARRCLNEAELFEPLKRAGYSIYTMEHMTFEEQIRLFRSSEIITGVHGAGMSWLLFCYPGTFLLEISIVGGEAYHRPHYEDICLQTGLRYYRYTKTLAPDKSIYPDCVIDDCVVNPDDYVRVAKAIIQLKEEESKQAQH
jgi:hypothetical protein